MDSEFYILSPTDYLNADQSDNLLGKIVKDYTHPLDDYVPADNEGTIFTQLSTDISDLAIKVASNRTRSIGIDVRLPNYTGIDTGYSIGVSSGRNRQFQFSGEKVTYLRLLRQTDIFQELMHRVSVRSKIFQWTKRTFKKRIPVCMVVGLLICESTSIRFVEEVATEVASNFSSRASTNTIASIAPVNLQTDNANMSPGDRGNTRKIFALQLRIVHRPLLSAKLVLTNERVFRGGTGIRPTTNIPFDTQSTAAENPLESDTLHPDPLSGSSSSGSEDGQNESQAVRSPGKTDEIKVQVDVIDSNLLGNPWDYADNNDTGIESVDSKQRTSKSDAASSAREEPPNPLLGQRYPSSYPDLEVSHVLHPKSDDTMIEDAPSQDYVYLGSSSNIGKSFTSKLPKSLPTCDNCQIERCYDIRVSTSLSKPNQTASNSFKCSIESWLGTSIDWWPLKNANHPPSPGYSRISWRWTNAVSNDTNEMDVLNAHVSEQLALLEHRTAVVCLKETHNSAAKDVRPLYNHFSSAHGESAAGSTTNVSELSSAAAETGAGASAGESRTSGVDTIERVRRGNHVQRRRPVNQEIASLIEQGCYLILTVNHGIMCHRFETIKLDEQSAGWAIITDENFCKILASTYRTLRGWRYWFGLDTIWKFKFVEVCSLLLIALAVDFTDRI